jgi:hypothetical protein
VNRLAPAHRRLIYLAGAALLASGLGWAAFHYLHDFLNVGEREALAVNALLMKIHGAAAMIALILIGSLLPRHVRIGWKLSANRKTGFFMLTLTGLLMVSGYLLYYSGDDAVRDLASWSHLAIGLALPLPLTVHVWRILLGRDATRVMPPALQEKRQRP